MNLFQNTIYNFYILMTKTIHPPTYTEQIYLYGTLTFILVVFCIKERLFDEGQSSSVHLRIKVVVEVVENNQRPHVVDEDESDDNHRQDEEDPECPDG